MWQEITVQQADNILSGVGDPIIEKMYDIQITHNNYYIENLSTEIFARTLKNKQDNDIRAFYYEDDKYEINLVTKFTESGKFRLLMTGLGKYDVVENAVAIGHAKLINLMQEYQETEVFALYPHENFEHGWLYFKAFANTENALANGFKISTDIQVMDKTWMWNATL